MSDFAPTRRWWPAELMDEWMPEGRRQPQDWLSPGKDGVTLVRDEDEAARVLVRIEPDETVEFCWHESRGGVEILLMPDGTWSVDDTRDTGTPDIFTGDLPMPRPPSANIEDANWFAEASDYETMAGTMDEFARAYAEMDDIEPEGRRIPVVMGRWSKHIAFRVSADGASLERVHG